MGYRRGMSKLTLILVALLVSATAAGAQTWPERIDLPDGFQPEGIAAGKGKELFVGSIPTGEIRRVNPRKGTTTTVVPGAAGRAAIGLKADRRRRLFVAGGATGKAFAYDARTGAQLGSFQLAPAGGDTFINDVALGGKRAYFTDSSRPVIYALDTDTLSAVAPIELAGFPIVAGEFNLNGIAAARGGSVLLAIQSVDGALWRIDAATGAYEQIDVPLLPNGDGLLLHGKRTLYVVQNTLDQVAVVRLSSDLRSGTVLRTITSSEFDVPTTVARIGKRLYLPNARFTTPPEADTPYWITQVGR
jgi:sugar lactone lactonase YvrE